MLHSHALEVTDYIRIGEVPNSLVKKLIFPYLESKAESRHLLTRLQNFKECRPSSKTKTASALISSSKFLGSKSLPKYL